MNIIGLKGENNSAWKGDKVGYNGIHAWIKNNYGKANKCEMCFYELAQYEWANISGQYKRDRNDWIMLCKKCHAKFDNKSQKMSIIRQSQETYKWLKNYYLGKRIRPKYSTLKKQRYLSRKLLGTIDEGL